MLFPDRLVSDDSERRAGSICLTLNHGRLMHPSRSEGQDEARAKNQEQSVCVSHGETSALGSSDVSEKSDVRADSVPGEA